MTILAMKTKKAGIIPDPEKIPEEITKRFGKEMSDALQVSRKDTYDDLAYVFTKLGALEVSLAAITEGLWEVDGSEHQLITADEIDMQSKNIINVLDPTANQHAATKKYHDDNESDTLPLSNVIFTWSGTELYSDTNYGAVIDQDITPDLGAGEGGALVLAVKGTTYRTMLNFRFKKIAGVDDVTIHARLWQHASGVDLEAVLNVDIGGQNAEVKGANNTSPAWVTAADIDVSGLTDGTVYDGIVQLKNEDGDTFAYCSAVTLIGS